MASEEKVMQHLASLFESEKANRSFRAVGLVASVCGFYCAPTLPIYTAAKQ